MVTDCQVRKLMKLLNEEQTLSLASAKSGMDEKTARKYRCLGKLPSEVRQYLRYQDICQPSPQGCRALRRW